MRVHSSNSAII
uniref:Uncharacterized protein n=1 Tax=Arundo donax TaxID=35708 RepID=A0A0A9C1M2_ARUDO